MRVSDFQERRLVVIHPPQIARASRVPLLQPFYPTDIGFFRSAANHERRRSSGSAQAIFIHCIEGIGWCEIDSVRHVITPGTLLVIPAKCAHAYGADSGAPWTIEWFHAAGSGVSEWLRRLAVTARAPVMALHPAAWDSALFEEALSGLEGRFTNAHLLCAALALSHLLARLVIRQNEGVADPSSPAARLENVAAFLRVNHAESPSVHDMALRAGLSPSHFTALFLKHTGHSPIDYLIRARIDHASRLLDLTSLSVKEIAARVGYADPYYFSRVFKRTTASSPKAYRTRQKG